MHGVVSQSVSWYYIWHTSNILIFIILHLYYIKEGIIFRERIIGEGRIGEGIIGERILLEKEQTKAYDHVESSQLVKNSPRIFLLHLFFLMFFLLLLFFLHFWQKFREKEKEQTKVYDHVQKCSHVVKNETIHTFMILIRPWTSRTILSNSQGQERPSKKSPNCLNSFAGTHFRSQISKKSDIASLK